MILLLNPPTFICQVRIFLMFQVGNIRNHNADGMPLVMTVMGLACGVSWLVYGLMLNDINIYVSITYQEFLLFSSECFLNYTRETYR